GIYSIIIKNSQNREVRWHFITLANIILAFTLPTYNGQTQKFYDQEKRKRKDQKKKKKRKKEKKTTTQGQPRNHKIDQAVKGTTTSNPQEPKAGEQRGGVAPLVSPYTRR
ncbi:hypothetical protein PanWU01x14_171000, partial [Parasponia andersonii]